MREPAAVVMNIRWSLKSNVKSVFFVEIEPFLVEILDAEPNLKKRMIAFQNIWQILIY